MSRSAVVRVALEEIMTSDGWTPPPDAPRYDAPPPDMMSTTAEELDRVLDLARKAREATTELTGAVSTLRYPVP